jgi:hypothetical protein
MLSPLLKDLFILNIAYITAVGFYRQARKEENISFFINLYKLNRLIENKDTRDKKT